MLVDDKWYIGVTEGNNPAYFLAKEEIIPGCWTLANGDPGYPDESNWIDVGEYTKPSEVLRVILQGYLDELIPELELDFTMLPDEDDENA